MQPTVQPAVLGGVFIGVLSALPLISAGNCCCCLWVIGGGVVAAYLLQQSQRRRSRRETARSSARWRACSAPSSTA